jgi:hypothetical protein
MDESFQQYVVRNKEFLCTCGTEPKLQTLRSPWAHYDECPQHKLYLNWRSYVEIVFPERVCPLPHGPVSLPDGP